ncbi:MAG: mechanosensitive ion channel family protein [Acidobacteria bacterium]|nr:mechanosensitive ion channel family protein [Acidobacteriota bacterium]
MVDWPEWLNALLWTAGAVVVGYLVGHLGNALLTGRLARVVRRTHGDWDDALVDEIGRRLPFWCVLIGLYVVLPRWRLPVEREVLAVTILRAIAIASATIAAATVAGRLVWAYGPRVTPNAPVSALTQNVVRTVVIVLGALVIIGSFGINITPYLTALGVSGLAVALALQDPLSNFFAGIAMSVSGQVRIGDYVRLSDGVEGHVLDFNWRTTTIRTLGNPIVIVPNAKLAQSIVTSYSDPEFGMSVDLQVHPASDLAAIERITLDVAREVMREVPGAVRTAEPAVRFHTFGPAGIGFSVGLRAVAFADQFLLKHEFLKRVQARYAAEGVMIPAVGLVAQPLLVAPEREPPAGRQS